MENKGWLRDHFHFSGRERTGLIVLLVVIGLVYASPLLLTPPTSVPVITVDSTLTIATGPAGPGRDRSSGKHPASERTYTTRRTLTLPKGPFNPNTLDDKGWQELGLSEKTIRTLRNYLNAGGRFRKPEDLKRIYGLHADDYARLAPYIRIGEHPEMPSVTFERGTRPPISNSENRKLDLNKADSVELEALPGIGPRLASRILLFRARLGGFYSVDQMRETFGLPDSVFQSLQHRFQVSGNDLRRIKINDATESELARHPYIRWPIARAITAYRKERGPIRSAEDLHRLQAIDPVQLNKMLPYLEWD